MIEITLKPKWRAYKCILAAILLLCAGPLSAAYTITGNELMLLPPFCRQLSPGNFDADAIRYRVNAPEPDWMQHFQHYCHGLKSSIRASKAMNETDRVLQLKAAVTEFEYVLTHTQPIQKYNPYLAMVRVDLGRTYIHMDKISNAIAQFSLASSLDPSFAVAYLELIDAYIKIGDRDKALSIAREGLIHNPKSKSLQKNYRELGGILPYPTPAQNTTINEAKQNVPSSTGSVSSDEDKNPQLPYNPGTATVAKPATPFQEQRDQKSKIGSPTNPWCRFCPPSDIDDPNQSPVAP